MKRLNCPLCHSVEIINYIEPKMVTEVHPVHLLKGEIHVGNYTRTPQGGGYDWSHADTCPKITQAWDKKHLLQSYLFDPEILHCDHNSFEDYELALGVLGIGIGMGVVRNGGSWTNQCFLFSNIRESGSKYNRAVASNPDKAFALLKHRLLCGELIHVMSMPVQMIRGETLCFKCV